jgi:hypothetical protein
MINRERIIGSQSTQTAVELLKINPPNNAAPSITPIHKGFPTLFFWPTGKDFTETIRERSDNFSEHSDR